MFDVVFTECTCDLIANVAIDKSFFSTHIAVLRSSSFFLHREQYPFLTQEPSSAFRSSPKIEVLRISPHSTRFSRARGRCLEISSLVLKKPSSSGRMQHVASDTKAKHNQFHHRGRPQETQQTEENPVHNGAKETPANLNMFNDVLTIDGKRSELCSAEIIICTQNPVHTEPFCAACCSNT